MAKSHQPTMFATPIEAEEKIAELAAAVGDRGDIQITHETDDDGRTEASVIRVNNLRMADNVEHLIAHYGFLISTESYVDDGVSLFKRVFVEY